MAYYSLTAAAKEIGICRAWLYRKYLTKYRPKMIGGSPKLTAHQVEQIQMDVNGTKKARKK